MALVLMPTVKVFCITLHTDNIDLTWIHCLLQEVNQRPSSHLMDRSAFHVAH